MVLSSARSSFSTQPLPIPLEAMAVLQVDLKAVAHNYKVLQSTFQGRRCGAVLKADAYSMGMEPVALVLEKAGCQDYFIAHIEEGIALRKILPTQKIYLLSGILPGTERVTHHYGLIPVLGDGAQLEQWRFFSRFQEGKTPLPAVIHLDTGMARNGLDRRETETLISNPQQLADLDIHYFLSHLACGEEEENPLNQKQLGRLQKILHQLPQAPVSLVNSAGIFLQASYHYDLARPGQALYGIQPALGKSPSLQRAFSFHGRVVQIRQAPAGTTVGYGGTYTTSRPSRLATLGVGYGDGYKRALSQKGWAYFNGYKVPVVGRVSMDYITVDITSLPEDHIGVGEFMELLGPHIPIETLAEEAQTIPHDILVGLGPRGHRIYNQ
jgi:alanine racemase